LKATNKQTNEQTEGDRHSAKRRGLMVVVVVFVVAVVVYCHERCVGENEIK